MNEYNTEGAVRMMILEMDRGVKNRIPCENIYIGKRVFDRYYGNGTVIDMLNDKEGHYLVEFDSGKRRYCLPKYFYEV